MKKNYTKKGEQNKKDKRKRKEDTSILKSKHSPNHSTTQSNK